MTVFEINAEIEKVSQKMEGGFDPETGEIIEPDMDAIRLELAELGLAKEEKAENIAYIMKEYKAAEAALGEEIKRLQERKAGYAKQQARLKELLDWLMHGEKLKTEKFTFFYKPVERIVIDDESDIPEDYVKVEFKIDKAGLKKAIKNGAAIEGAHIEKDKVVVVR
ncbi:siphovirus Gp157 family protein [Hydrogenimonas sp.]